MDKGNFSIHSDDDEELSDGTSKRREKISFWIDDRCKSETPSKMMQLSKQNFFRNMHNEDQVFETGKQHVSLTMKHPLVKERIKADAEKARKITEKPAIFQKVIIDPTWKSMVAFTFIMIICSLASSLFAAYFACFGEPTGTIHLMETTMEICFVVDMVTKFFTSYTDVRTRKPVKDLFMISKNYVKGAFFFDLVALSAWPIRLAVRNSWDE